MPETTYKETFPPEETSYRLPFIRSDVNILQRDVETIKADVTDIKHDMTALKSDVNELKSTVRVQQNDISELKSDVKNMRVEISDLKGEVRTLGTRLDGMDRRIDDIHNSQNKWFTLLGLLITIVPIAIAIIQSIIRK